MKTLIYFYEGDRKLLRGLNSVPIVDGHCPPIVEWLDALWLWDEPLGAYYLCTNHETIVKIAEPVAGISLLAAARRLHDANEQAIEGREPPHDFGTSLECNREGWVAMGSEALAIAKEVAEQAVRSHHDDCRFEICDFMIQEFRLWEKKVPDAPTLAQVIDFVTALRDANQKKKKGPVG